MELSLLTELQTDTLRALADCIVPADDYSGGWDAGVGDYLVRLLTREQSLLFAYRAGLDALESEVKARACTMAVLAMLAAGVALPAAQAQDLGYGLNDGYRYYADPGNGGNRGGIAWQMLGYKVTA